MTSCNNVPHMTNRNVADAQRLTRGEAADVLRVSISTIDRYLKDGTLPKAKVGKRLVRIDRVDVFALLVPVLSVGTSPEAVPTEGTSIGGRL